MPRKNGNAEGHFRCFFSKEFQFRRKTLSYSNLLLFKLNNNRGKPTLQKFFSSHLFLFKLTLSGTITYYLQVPARN